MKKYLIILFSVLFVFSLTTNAQEQAKQKKGKGKGIEKQAEKMAVDLGLNGPEKAQFITLLQKQQADRKKFTSENLKESAEYKQKLKNLRKAQETELKALLGNNQFKKYQELKKSGRKSTKKSE